MILEDTYLNIQEGNVIVSASDASIQVFTEEAGAGTGHRKELSKVGRRCTGRRQPGKGPRSRRLHEQVGGRGSEYSWRDSGDTWEVEFTRLGAGW